MANEPDPKLQENLLFGILAEANSVISRVQLIAALEQWMHDKTRELKEILVEQRALTDAERQQLEPMVALHIQRHGNDAAASLEAISDITSAVGDIRALEDTHLAESLNFISAGPPVSSGSGGTSRLSRATRGPADLSNARFHIVSPAVNGGGLGVISIARDNDIRREVVVKQIRPERASSDQAKAQFLLEAEITGLLEHPGIVPVYGLGHDEQGRPFYAMRLIRGVVKSDKQDAYAEQEEYETLATQPHGGGARAQRQSPSPAPGKTLHDAIRDYHAESPPEDALTLNQILRRFLDVCHAVHYAHTRDILHRDLKPKNIMLGQHGETLVIDWGLACVSDKPSPSGDSLRDTVTDPTTGSGSAVGTPGFMSPEQAAGLQLDARTDVYSLGATLYALLTGRSAFSLADIQTDKRLIAAKAEDRRAVGLRLLTERILAGEMPRPRDVLSDTPRALEAICLKAMASNPEDRYQTVEALSEDVERWLDDQPVLAWREPLTVRLARQLRKRPRIVAGTTAALLVGLILSLIGSALINAQKQRAENLFVLANQAVDDYFTAVSEETLLDSPGMLPLRTKLLESATDFFNKLANDDFGNSLAFRRERSLAFFRLGLIEEAQENSVIAKAHFQTALDQQTQLTQEYPSDLIAHREASRSETALARLAQTQLDNQEEALRRYMKAIELRKQIVQQTSAKAEDYRLLGNAHMNLAQYWREKHRNTYSVQEAGRQLRMAQDANAIAHSMPSKPHTSLSVQRDLVKILYNQGANELIAVKRDLPSLSGGTQASKDALDLVEDLILKNSQSQELSFLRANVLTLLSETVPPSQTLERQLEAFNQLWSLSRANPANAQYASELRKACHKVADGYRMASWPNFELWYRVQGEFSASLGLDSLATLFARSSHAQRGKMLSTLLKNESNQESPAMHYLQSHAQHHLTFEQIREGKLAQSLESAQKSNHHINTAIALAEDGTPPHYRDLQTDCRGLLLVLMLLVRVRYL